MSKVINKSIYENVLNFIPTICTVSTLKKLILILGRENLHKDSDFYEKVVTSFDRKTYNIKFDPTDELSSIHAKVKLFGSKFSIGQQFAESFYDKLLKLKFIISHRIYNRSYFKIHKQTFRDFEFRKAILSHYLNRLPRNQEIYLIGRSAGAILATQLADSYPIKKVICLGYPFKHPEKEEESYRTAHLKKLRTPTIIFQGIHDEYGNIDKAKKYALSPAIQLIELRTNHEYHFTEDDLALLKKAL